MKIAIMHYHLKPGGVTTVIRRQISALKSLYGKDVEILVITGEAPQDFKNDRRDVDAPYDLAVIPGIGYDKVSHKPNSPEVTARFIIDVMRRKWPEKGCDILHVHNPTLAKNRFFLNILKILQKEGVNLILQIHDFAEDGRPTAYFDEPYPENCHFAVINGRDYNNLYASGLNKSGLHLLPNAVIPFTQGDAVSGNYILYPVRAIRRKNIREAALISFYLSKPLKITLPPNSPSDMAPYENFTVFIRTHGLPIEIGAGIDHNFSELVQNALFILTTSITEGFGFTYTEPWTMGKYVVGRRLSGITDDFEKNGIVLSQLYSSLNIPLSWAGQSYLSLFRKIYREMSAFFGKDQEAGVLESFIKGMEKNRVVDMGLLNETFQDRVLKKVLSDSAAKTVLEELNPFLKRLSAFNPDTPKQKNILDKNRETVVKQYDLNGNGRRLMEIYGHTLSRTVIHKIDKAVLVKRYLDPSTFSLLKWGKP